MTSRELRRRGARRPRPNARRHGGRPCPTGERRQPPRAQHGRRSDEPGPTVPTRRTRLPRCGEIDDGDRAATRGEAPPRPRPRRSRPHRSCRCPRRRADPAGAAAAARPRSRGPAAVARRPGDGRRRAAGAASATLSAAGAIRPTLTGTGTPRALATSDRRRSRSEVMARNSTVPQPSAAPPMSPDARTSAMRALRPARLGGRRVEHPAGRHHRRVAQAWRPPRTAARFRSGPGCMPAGRSRRSACSRSGLPAAESRSICLDSSCDVGLQLVDALPACRRREFDCKASCSARNSR